MDPLRLAAVRNLLGCQWGPDGIHTVDDQIDCREQAAQRAALHHSGDTIYAQFCQRHLERIIAETDPHRAGA